MSSFLFSITIWYYIPPAFIAHKIILYKLWERKLLDDLVYNHLQGERIYRSLTLTLENRYQRKWHSISNVCLIDKKTFIWYIWRKETNNYILVLKFAFYLRVYSWEKLVAPPENVTMPLIGEGPVLGGKGSKWWWWWWWWLVWKNKGSHPTTLQKKLVF